METDPKPKASTSVTHTTTELPPATLATQYITSSPRKLEIRCPDRFLRDCTVKDKDNGQLLFTLSSATINHSLSLRKTLVDASGHEVLLVRFSTTLKYTGERLIECPPGTEVARTRHSKVDPGRRVRQEVTLKTEGGEVVVAAEAKDAAGLTTRFFVGNEEIAELLMVENNDLEGLHDKGLDRSGWRLTVAAGVDLALILAITFDRIEGQHAYRR
ncbi:Hypothetical protein D9617_23g005400 [Elsinoe fawcettii]|nr:Hypothetical protein D9617_23g005400 [Elsinoe fawcettii]